MQLLSRASRRRDPRMALAGWLARGSILLCLGIALTAGMAPALAELTPDGAIAPDTLGSGLQREPGAALEPARALRIRRIIAEFEQACLAAGAPPGDAAAQIAIERAVAAIAISPLGSWLLREARERQVWICLDPTTELAAYYRAELGLIGVQAALATAARTGFLAHELAHVPQHPRYSNDRSLPVHDLIVMQRLREATAEAIATRVLWQMRARGWSAPWRAKLASGYRDIARAFAMAMASAPAGDDPGARELRATRAAFDRWFAWPERLRLYDDHMLDHIERIARDRPGLMPPRRTLSEAFLREIAWYAGESFLAAATVRPLAEADYRADLSAENAARLASILGGAAGGLASDAAAWQADPAPPQPE